ncbi:MAG: Ig-like domain repeat protein [Marmoricola sp.]
MLRVKHAMGAVTIAAMTMTGVALAAPPVAQAGILCTRLTALTAPLVSGSGAVDEPLTITTMPTWSCGLTSEPTVQWYDAAGPIAGATGTTYTPTADEAGGAVLAGVTAQVLGLLPVPATSNAVPIALPSDPGGTGGTGGTTVDPVLDLASPLTVTGTPAVGQLLAVAAPVWNLPGVTTTYQWLRDGAPIPDATGATYVPVVGDAGHTLVAQVTGTLVGLPAVVRPSGPLAIPVVADPVLALVDAVTVSGPGMIGTALGVTGPTWSPADATTRYQWLRDGVPVPGATNPTYLLQAVDYGHAITVTATGELAGWVASTASSAATSPVLGAPLAPGTAPRITGTAKVGRLLTADPGTWTGGDLGDLAPPTYSYQWLRGGAPIDGAVAQTYQASIADIGSALTVAVTAVRPGYGSGQARTAAVSVARLGSTLQATLARKVVRTPQRGVLKLRLRVPGVAAPTGAVEVVEGRRVVGRGTFVRTGAGALSLRLGTLKPGVHRLKAVYAGSRTVAGSSARVVRLTVRR